MMLIDYTFFRGGPLDIEGAVLCTHTPSGTNEAIVDSLRRFIGLYEPEYLTKLLGEKLYGEFSSYLSGDREPPESRWDDLADLLVVRYGEGDGAACKSPVANYVYFHYLRHSHAQATVTGVKEDGDDGTLVSPERKMVYAWNDMVGMTSRIVCRLRVRASDYPCLHTDPELLETINTLGI